MTHYNRSKRIIQNNPPIRNDGQKGELPLMLTIMTETHPDIMVIPINAQKKNFDI